MKRKLIVTDGIFSMDGDVAPLEDILELASNLDDIVDLALGTYFRKLQPNTDAEEVLSSLKTVAPGGAGAVDIDLLKAARTAHC